MTSLPAMLGTVQAMLQSHPICRRVVAVETREFTADQFILKIKAEFPDNTSFQIRVYFNRGHVDYAYQLYSATPLLRWDNKEEFRAIPTYPHHHHDADGGIHPSALIGDPPLDLQIVLGLITEYLAAH